MKRSISNGLANDWLSVVAISALGYILATFLHEVAGHGLTCLLVGGKLAEVGAFYVNCDYQNIADLSIRLVALAGPLVSLLLGLVSFLILDRISMPSSHWKYFIWLLGTLGLLTATGYLLFSGVSGLGDFGTSRDGVIYQLEPEWLWRVLLILAGLGGYYGSIYFSLRRMAAIIGGSGQERVQRAQRLSLTSYLTGGIVSVLIGFLNPLGIVIVLISAAAASLGGTSALAWMMQLLNRKIETSIPLLSLQRSWVWIGVALLAVLLYAAILGPTLKP